MAQRPARRWVHPSRIGTTKNLEGRALPITPALQVILERRLEFTRRCERAQDRIIPWVFHRKGQRVKTMT
jgi:hypothetical protein